ncbi:MAG: helix-turn-helix transcriptional regulator [Bacilli bacterium]|nr:helix-turn-helix transcriptional regulator [Bacilli bacterium]
MRKMERLNDILRELGISKVKLAKCLGVSRQMIYNYLELDDLNKWPKDKKVILLNILGIKSAADLDDIKVDTDYIMDVEMRVNSLFENTNKSAVADNNQVFSGLGVKQKELLHNIIDEVKERLEDEKDETSYSSMLYLYHFLQTMEGSKELRYILAYMSKAAGYTKPYEFVYDETDQFIFESILFSALSLYHGGNASKSKIAATHKRFVDQIEQKMEDKMSRTLEINSAKVQALKELGYTEINEDNAAEVLAKIVEIQSRKVGN